MTSNRHWTKFSVLTAFLMFAAQIGWARGRGYSVTELPPLETSVGVMTAIGANAISNSGHVVGTAVLIGDDLGRRAAFFFSETTGMKDLDPDGDYHSQAMAIHDREWIYGIRDIASSPKPFLYDADFVLDNLKKNANEVIAGLAPFNLWDMNASGTLVGCAQSCTRPVMYTRDDGWLDLSRVDPRFRPRNTVARLINDAGDLVFTIGHPGGFQESFVLLGQDTLVELGHFGTFVNVPSGINNERLMSGISRTAGSDPNVQADGDDHAYFYRPDRGVVDIHPKRFRQSAGMGVTEDGIIVGLLYRKGWDGVFIFNGNRGKKLRILAKRRDFRRMFPKGTGFRFLTVGDFHHNQRLEFIGSVHAPPTDDPTVTILPQRFFYLSREKGLLDLQEILTSTGYDGEIAWPVDINDQGQILLSVYRSGPHSPSRPREASVILTPME